MEDRTELTNMKKELLFVIDSLTIGGAEKSLISLLNILDFSRYEVDLLMFKRGGDLEKYVPEEINILPVPEYFCFLNGEKFSLFKNMAYFSSRLQTTISLQVNNFKKKPLHSEQVVFSKIKKNMEMSLKVYDVAIAYSQGMPTYYVANKVQALRKLGWVNTDYVNTLYDKEIDYQSYRKLDRIIAVSQYIKESIAQMKDEYRNKIELILDIVNPELITRMADEDTVKEFETSTTNILTVGRLVTAKSLEKAVQAAYLLRNSGYFFKWYVIGEGPEWNNLQDLINRYKLVDYFVLLGKRINPYPYMKQCDIYVQTSIKEGFGLTVCEAKILKRPIVCTNFHTAKELINDKVDGLIVDHDHTAISNGIKKYLDDHECKRTILNELNSKDSYNSVDQLLKFYNLIEAECLEMSK